MTIGSKALAVLAATLIALPAAALASGSQSSTVTITGNVVANCVGFAQTNTLTFSAYDVFASTIDAASTSYNINCTKGSSPTITIDGGQNTAGGNRYMNDGQGHGAASLLQYNLFQDTGATNPWPIGTAVAEAGHGSAATEVTTITVQGQIPVGQDVEVGNYTDSLQVTLNF